VRKREGRERRKKRTCQGGEEREGANERKKDKRKEVKEEKSREKKERERGRECAIHCLVTLRDILQHTKAEVQLCL
jgi:hypothetical protein